MPLRNRFAPRRRLRGRARGTVKRVEPAQTPPFALHPAGNADDHSAVCVSPPGTCGVVFSCRAFLPINPHGVTTKVIHADAGVFPNVTFAITRQVRLCFMVRSVGSLRGASVTNARPPVFGEAVGTEATRRLRRDVDRVSYRRDGDAVRREVSTDCSLGNSQSPFLGTSKVYISGQRK